MRKLFAAAIAAVSLLGLSALPAATSAWAQNVVCPNAPPGDSSNKCASTAFVQEALALGPGQILIGQASGSPLAKTVSGDGTLSPDGVLTVGKTNGVPFAPSATIDTTNASNISSGTLGSGLLPAPFTNGTASGNTNKFGTVGTPFVNGNCVQVDAGGNLTTAATSCLSVGAGVSSGSVPRKTSAPTFLSIPISIGTNGRGKREPQMSLVNATLHHLRACPRDGSTTEPFN
jgi:hypothetical protein